MTPVLVVVEAVTVEASGFSEDAWAYIRAARDANTDCSYRTAWAPFEVLCTARGRRALPADVSTIVEYITTPADRVKPATLDARLARRGARRSHGTGQRQVRPVLVSDLRAMVAGLGDEAAGHRDRALLLLGFAGALRRSELVVLGWGHRARQRGDEPPADRERGRRRRRLSERWRITASRRHRIYAAHPMTCYFTTHEQRFLDAIADAFPEAEVFNPAGRFRTNASWLRAWPRLLPTLDAGVVFGDEDGVIGVGCLKEIADAIRVGLPVTVLDENGQVRERVRIDLLPAGRRSSRRAARLSDDGL